MNTTTRTALRLLIATPLAASAVVIGGYAGVAHADTPAFDPSPGVIIAQPEDDEDPKPKGPGDIAIPKDDVDPKPKGPGDIANPEPGDDPKPKGPGDIANPEPGDDPKPKGPGDIANPEPGDDPGPQVPGDKAGPNHGDQPDDVPGDVPVDKGNKGGQGGPADQDTNQDADQVNAEEVDAAGEVPVPNRIDAGSGPVEEDGLNLAWVLAGGGVVTAVGSAFARRRLATNR